MTEHFLSTERTTGELSARRQMTLLMAIFVTMPTISTTSGTSGILGSDIITGEFCQFDVFNATCSSTEVILMQSAVYGRLRVGRCVKQGYGVMDCKVDVLGFTDYRCSGRRHCKFPVSDISHQGIQPCAEFTSNLDVSYRCVQVDDVIGSSCSSLKQKTLKSVRLGYLTQSFQQDRIIPPLACGWILEADPGHRIQITLYYFVQVTNGEKPLHGSSAGNDVTIFCRRLAKIRDKQSGKETNVCAVKDRVRNIFLSDSNSVEIVLTGRPENNHDPHFLFKYEVTGCGIPSYPGRHVIMTSDKTAAVICNETNQRWTMTCVESSWIGTVGECTESMVHEGDQMSSWSALNYEWKSAKGLTLVVGLGIILGIAVGMLMLAIAACLIRGEHVCFPHTEPCSELEMMEDGGHLVDQNEPAQWTCTDRSGRCEKELFSGDVWRMNEQRLTHCPTIAAAAAAAASSERHSASGYQTFYADCGLTGSHVPETTCPVTLIRENRCQAFKHCYDSPGI